MEESHPEPQRLPEEIAELMAAVSSVTPEMYALVYHHLKGERLKYHHQRHQNL